MKKHVLITCPQLQDDITSYINLFDEKGIDIDLPAVNQQLNESDLLPIIDKYDGVIAGDDQFTATVINKARKLKVISRWGVGIDGIDLEAAKANNILIYNTPNTFNNEVADVVFGYIIMLTRQLHIIDQEVRKGHWAKPRGTSLKSKTLGIIGCGNTGMEVSQRGFTAGMSVLGHDIPPIRDDSGIVQVNLNTQLKESDVISLNCNLTDSNVHMLSYEQFRLMKKESYIINCARGPLIDESALIDALQSNSIAGAALDVLELEPLTLTNDLCNLKNCILGSHNSSNTHEAVARVNTECINNLFEGLETTTR